MASRQTIQRELIKQELCSMANHPTADEVYASIHEKHPTISKATVFRTLGRLADDGEALRVRINNGALRPPDVCALPRALHGVWKGGRCAHARGR